jgi:hypothetical protein
MFNGILSFSAAASRSFHLYLTLVKRLSRAVIASVFFPERITIGWAKIHLKNLVQGFKGEPLAGSRGRAPGLHVS